MSSEGPVRSVRLADRTIAIERSRIRYMFDRAAAHDGELVHLEIGEPDFETPAHIIDAAFEAVRNGATHYTANAGIPQLREAIGNRMATNRGVDIDPMAQVVVTNGAMEALHIAMLTVVNDGEKVLIPEPSWPNYRAHVQLAGAEPVSVPLDAASGFGIEPARFEDAITEDTAAVILSTPANPTGRVYSCDAIREVTRIASEFDAYVVADEVYSEIEYREPSPSVASIADSPRRVLTVDSVSKKYAMTGWRVGWLVANSDVIEQATKLRENTTACAPSPSQHAAVAALSGEQEVVEMMRATYEERRNILIDSISEIEGISCLPPDGTFYAFADVTSFGDPSLAIAERLLDDYRLVVVPGSGFGAQGEGYIRLSFANDVENINAGVDALRRFAMEERR